MECDCEAAKGYIWKTNYMTTAFASDTVIGNLQMEPKQRGGKKKGGKKKNKGKAKLKLSFSYLSRPKLSHSAASGGFYHRQHTSIFLSLCCCFLAISLPSHSSLTTGLEMTSWDTVRRRGQMANTMHALE